MIISEISFSNSTQSVKPLQTLIIPESETHSEFSQTSMVELFAKIVNQPLTSKIVNQPLSPSSVSVWVLNALVRILFRDHLCGTCAKFPLKLTFTPCYAHVHVRVRG